MTRMLLTYRPFVAMLWCMAGAAFNDNFYKNAFIILITYRLTGTDPSKAAFLISIASACFILPFFLFSGMAGDLADKISRSKLIRILKAAEFGIYLLAGIALLWGHVWFMMLALFLMGALSAFFGPVKYAILPELLNRDEILRATGYVEGTIYGSILIGTLLGALLILQPNGGMIVTGIMAATGILGILAAWAVPPTPASEPSLKVQYNIFAAILALFKFANRNALVLAAVLGISWFWSIGATYLTQIPVFTKEVVGANERVVSLYMAIYTIGIAAGSLTCHRLIKYVDAGKLAPLALLGVMISGLDVCYTAYGMAAPSGELIGLGEYFEATSRWRLVFDLAAMAFCGGLFIVPLYAMLQTDSHEKERARTIASNNVINALFIAVAAGMAAVFYKFGLHVRDVLLIFALLNIPVIVLLWRRRKA